MSNQLPIPFNGGVPAHGAPGGHYPAGFDGAGEGGGSGDMGIRRYLGAILRYKWMILVITVLGTAGGAYFASKQALIYQTRARIWFGTGLTGEEVGIQQGTLLRSGWQQLLRSSAVLDTVVLQERLFLTPALAADSAAFHGFELDETSFRPGAYALNVSADRSGYELVDRTGSVVDRGALGDSIGSTVGFRWNPSPDALPAGRPLAFSVSWPKEVAGSLGGDLGNSSMDPRRGDANFMDVWLRGIHPEDITTKLTAVVRRFEAVSLELKSRRLAEQAAILNTQLNAAEGTLTTAENELESFKVSTITLPNERAVPVNPGIQATEGSALGNYWKLTTERELYRRDREAILNALEVRDPIMIVNALELVPSVRNSSELTSALGEAAKAEAGMRALRVTLTDEHPQVLAQRQHLDSLRNYVIPTYAHQLASQLTVLEGTADELIASSAGELREIPERAIREQQLIRQAQISEEVYKRLESQHHQALIAELTARPDMQVLDWPSEPTMPVEDPRLNLLLMAMVGSLGLGLAGALLRDRLDPRLRYPDEVTGGLGLFILGAVPALRRGKLGATDMALAVESFRAIQLALQHAHGAPAPLVITLTSPGASDGKSFVTSNLAIAFADMGHRTLIIDGDVRRGTIHQLMGSKHKPGLTDHLAGHARREQIVQRTRYALLDMIPCGSRGEAGPKLLGSAAMSRLMQDLRKDYDVILVDSPPLGACADPMILGTLTGNLVLVLRTGTTDRVMAESKLQILDRMPVRVLGAVLNDVPSRGPYRYYSYIAGYEVLDDVGTGQEVGSLPGGAAPGESRSA